MQLIKTHDGMVGIQHSGGKIVWCDQAEVVKIMWATFGPRAQITKEVLDSEVATAMNAMAAYGHDVAEFGALGYFLYSYAEEYDDVAL